MQEIRLDADARGRKSKPAALSIADGCVVAIGNFDGVHVGHKAVLSAAARLANEQGVGWGVVTFSPHPVSFFSPGAGPRPLTPIAEKTRIFAHLGASYHVLVNFDSDLAAMPAERFIELVLEGHLNAGSVVTGLDFRFGRKRSGDVHTLKYWADQTGRSTEAVTPQGVEGDSTPVSSTRIRAALDEGDTGFAERLLGRKYSISGEVARGDQRGRTIGFPTINLVPNNWYVPCNGAYSVLVDVDGIGKAMAGVGNIGFRPTVGGSAVLLEAHLFDFEADVYGKQARVWFGDFLRPECKFADIDALKAQIAEDCINARSSQNS